MVVSAAEDGVRIPLRARDGSVRAYTIVDAADADWANQWRWSLNEGYAHRKARVSNQPRKVYLHRALLGLHAGEALIGDHINRDRLDCRRSNLRTVTRAGNTQNRGAKAGASSRYRGVGWHRASGKWRAYVRADNKSIHLGLFTDEVEAAEVARSARLRLMPYTIEAAGGG